MGGNALTFFSFVRVELVDFGPDKRVVDLLCMYCTVRFGAVA